MRTYVQIAVIYKYLASGWKNKKHNEIKTGMGTRLNRNHSHTVLYSLVVLDGLMFISSFSNSIHKAVKRFTTNLSLLLKKKNTL